MKNVFVEIGYGNETFMSTEIEDENSEYRVSRFVLPKKLVGIYFRLWIFKRVYILSTKNGFEITRKDKNKFKIIFGIRGEGLRQEK